MSNDVKKSRMNLPNRLTVFRLILIPLFIAFFYVPFTSHYIVALVIFVAATITDLMDGRIARKRGLITNFGKFLDPIADKVLVASAFILFLSVPSDFFTVGFGGWIMIVAGVGVAIILAREIIVSGLRMVASDSGVVIAADMIGKYKTTSQDICIVVLLACACIAEFTGYELTAVIVLNYVGLGIFAVAIVLTLISGINYIVKNRQILRT